MNDDGTAETGVHRHQSVLPATAGDEHPDRANERPETTTGEEPEPATSREKSPLAEGNLSLSRPAIRSRPPILSNRSTRGTTDSKDAPVETAAALETVDELVDRTNGNHNATHETATENLTSMVEAVAPVRRAEAASEGAHNHVAIVDQAAV